MDVDAKPKNEDDLTEYNLDDYDNDTKDTCKTTSFCWTNFVLTFDCSSRSLF